MISPDSETTNPPGHYTHGRLPLDRAERIANAIVVELRPFCARIEIAGSIRRRCAYVGDIDLVVLPKTVPHITRILERCGRNAAKVKHGDQYCVFRLANGFQLDLWFAHPGQCSDGDLLAAPIETSPPNFGVLLLARTGSAMHNVWIAQQATAKGLHFNPHRGIQVNAGKLSRVLASEEEADIFRVLDLDFIPPERRER